MDYLSYLKKYMDTNCIHLNFSGTPTVDDLFEAAHIIKLAGHNAEEVMSVMLHLYSTSKAATSDHQALLNSHNDQLQALVQQLNSKK